MKLPSIKPSTYYPLFIFLLFSFCVIANDHLNLNDRKWHSGLVELPVPVFVPILGSPIEMGSTTLEDVVVGDFDCNGQVDIAVPAYNGMVLIAHRSGDQFVTSVVNSGTTFLRGAATGDFDNDGCDDLAAVDSSSPGLTIALRGQPDGLTPVVSSPMLTPSVPWGVDVGDFNADGLDDIVTADASNDLAYVFFANSKGGFSIASTFSLGRNSVHVEIADFDNNGTADIISSNRNENSATILLNNGVGSFLQALSSPLSVLLNPCRPLAVDLNSDGNMDIVFRSDSRFIAYYLGDGAANFGQATTIRLPLNFNFCGQFTAADFDGNGKLDLAIPADDRIYFLYQRENGTFRHYTSEPYLGLKFKGLTVFDFDSDGKVELVASAQRSQEALILILKGLDILFTSGFE